MDSASLLSYFKKLLARLLSSQLELVSSNDTSISSTWFSPLFLFLLFVSFRYMAFCAVFISLFFWFYSLVSSLFLYTFHCSLMKTSCARFVYFMQMNIFTERNFNLGIRQEKSSSSIAFLKYTLISSKSFGNKLTISGFILCWSFAAPPTVTIDADETIKAIDSPITLHCHALGNPQPSLSWSMGGQPLISSAEG